MKNASTSLVAAAIAIASSGLLASDAQAGPMGPSATMAARLKKYPSSAWLAHYLPDDRYKIAGGVWKYVSTDLDTFYHLPNSPLMLRQPAGRVIGFASVQEAEEAGYRPDPNLGSFGDMGMDMASIMSTPRAANARRVMLADGVSSLSLPRGWRKAPARKQRSQFASSTNERFFGPRGERFEVAIVSLIPSSTGPSAKIDVSQFINVRFFNQMKANMRSMAGSIDRVSQSSGVVNSQFSGQNMISQLNRLNDYNVFRIKMSGIEGVGSTLLRPVAGQPKRTYTIGRGRKVWSIGDFSPRSSGIASILKTVRFR